MYSPPRRHDFRLSIPLTALYRIISTQSISSVHVCRWDEFRNPAFHRQPLRHALGMHHETSVARPGFVLKKLILGVATFKSVDGSWMCISGSLIMGSAPLTAGPERNRLGLWRIGEDLPSPLIYQGYASVRERDWHALCVPGLRSALCRPAGIRLTTDLATPRRLTRARPLSASKYNQSPPKTTCKSKSRPLPGTDLIVPVLVA